jgi:hypothetical protein
VFKPCYGTSGSVNRCSILLEEPLERSVYWSNWSRNANVSMFRRHVSELTVPSMISSFDLKSTPRTAKTRNDQGFSAVLRVTEGLSSPRRYQTQRLLSPSTILDSSEKAILCRTSLGTPAYRGKTKLVSACAHRSDFEYVALVGNGSASAFNSG